MDPNKWVAVKLTVDEVRRYLRGGRAKVHKTKRKPRKHIRSKKPKRTAAPAKFVFKPVTQETRVRNV